MIKNIIFDFDGVLVDSEAIIAKSFSRYLADRNITFSEKQFYDQAGRKTIEIVTEISSKYDTLDPKLFYQDVMNISNNLYTDSLEPTEGIINFLDNTNHNRYIGSNNIKQKIINGLRKVNIYKHFKSSSIFSFDIVQKAKPMPDIFLKPFEVDNIQKKETIIIEDSLVGVKAAVAAGVRVVVITVGSHWYEGRSKKELYEAGAFEVVNSFTEMLKLINKL